MVDSDDDGDREIMAAYPLDILEYANSYAFVIDMPGLDPDHVRVQVKPCNVLLISGEGRRVEVEGAKYIRMERRIMRRFERKFSLPENANTGKIATVSRNGVLTVTVEKLPPPPQPKTIEVKHEQLGCRGEDERKVRLISAVDRISLLPDELLLCVLSFLSFREATATSLLCRRWRYLHTLSPELDFDGTKLETEAEMCNYKGFDEVVGKYMSWVDGVVRLNRSSYLEKFRVLFCLRESHTQQIDEWVRFALSRKVQSLELISISDWKEYYTLNLHKFGCDLNFLRKLSTQCVKVSGEAVEMLLRNCPLLEQVSISQSDQLFGLEIINPFPSFRSLEIVLCDNLTSFVVDGSNIAIVKYCGHIINKVVLVNVPLLTEIWIDGVITGQVEDVVEMFSSVLPQLHTFKLRFQLFSKAHDFCSKFSSLTNMTSLKQLVVDISGIDDDQDLLPLIDLIRASPHLQRFVIEESYEEGRADFVEVEPMEIPIASSADGVFLKDYTELKEVEFVGYRGVSKHFELLKHLVENAIALETLVVDPWGFEERMHTISFDHITRRKYNEKIFARANALKHLISFGINVRIL